MNTNKTPSPFIPFDINIVDCAEILSAILLVITGYNIGNSSSWYAISTGCLYAGTKKFIELAKAKTTPGQSDPNKAEPASDVLPKPDTTA